MAYFKYLPYFFLIVALLFSYDAWSRYDQNGDPLPSLLLAAAAVAMFFIRRQSYKRFRNPKN